MTATPGGSDPTPLGDQVVPGSSFVASEATPSPFVAGASAPPAVAPAPRSGSRWLNVALALATGLAVAGVAFAIGRTTAPSALEQLGADGLPGGGVGRTFIGGSDGQGAIGGRIPFLASGGIAMEGTVEAIDADSLTLTTADGQTVEIVLDDETDYHTASDASADKVTAGSKVVVRVQPGSGLQGGQPGQSSGQPGAGGPVLGADDVTVVP